MTFASLGLATLGVFAALFPIVNPIGGLAVFFALTAHDGAAERNASARRVAIYVVAILLVFAVAGLFILAFFQISLPALRIAGGLIVAHTAWTMVTASSRLTATERAEAQEKEDIAFTPMAMPMLAGPGAIGVVVTLIARPDPTHVWHVATGIAILAIGVVVYVLLRYGGPLSTRLGPVALGVIDRIFGFLILAIAVQLVINGIAGMIPELSGQAIKPPAM